MEKKLFLTKALVPGHEGASQRRVREKEEIPVLIAQVGFSRNSFWNDAAQQIDCSAKAQRGFEFLPLCFDDHHGPT